MTTGLLERDDRAIHERDTDPPGEPEASGSEGVSRGCSTAGAHGLRIFAFDGGNTTGTALYDRGSVHLGRAIGRSAAYDLLAITPDIDCYAYEQFVIRQPLKEDHATVVYVNGAIEAEARRRGVPVHRYTPRQSKSRVSDDQLHALGWYPKFGLRTGGHAADAARILLCTLIDHYPLELMEKNLDA